MAVDKVSPTLLVFIGLCVAVAATDKAKQNLRFSRPTVKGIILNEAPARFRTVYKDHQYEFAVADKRTGEPEPLSLFAHDLVGERWIQITELSTENSRLGKSFDNKPGNESDFRVLTNSEYASIPIQDSRIGTTSRPSYS